LHLASSFKELLNKEVEDERTEEEEEEIGVEIQWYLLIADTAGEFQFRPL
jgi:hypothetical protein